jgi:UDP-2,3-diacylglucosamine pyrophosphatase LpxH
LRSPLGRPIFAAVPGPTLIVVSDAHLGVTPPAVEAALLAFLETVPTLGDSLLINGDLFDFWYSYSRVIPRRGFHVVAALERTARLLTVRLGGGNHDRWGGDFWERDLGLRLHPHRLNFRLGGTTVAAFHGVGLTEPRWVRAIEIRPSTVKGRRITHHALAYLQQNEGESVSAGDVNVGPGLFMEWAVGKTGEIFPDAAFEEVKQLDAILLGAIGDPRAPVGLIEYGIIAKMRFELVLYVNLRPIKLFDERLCPIKGKTADVRLDTPRR